MVWLRRAEKNYACSTPILIQLLLLFTYYLHTSTSYILNIPWKTAKRYLLTTRTSQDSPLRLGLRRQAPIMMANGPTKSPLPLSHDWIRNGVA